MQYKPYLEQKIIVQLRELIKNVYENSQPVLATFTKFSFSDEGPSLEMLDRIPSVCQLPYISPTSLYFAYFLIFRQLPYISPTFSYFANLFIFRQTFSYFYFYFCIACAVH